MKSAIQELSNKQGVHTKLIYHHIPFLIRGSRSAVVFLFNSLFSRCISTPSLDKVLIMS